MLELFKSSSRHELTVGLDVEIAPVASTGPTVLIGPLRIRGEEHTVCFERLVELALDTREFLAGTMKNRCIRKDSIKVRRRQVETKEFLMPHFTARVRSRHLGKRL